jgi:hypothetical protein
MSLITPEMILIYLLCPLQVFFLFHPVLASNLHLLHNVSPILITKHHQSHNALPIHIYNLHLHQHSLHI